jgi:hypothetical protein
VLPALIAALALLATACGASSEATPTSEVSGIDPTASVTATASETATADAAPGDATFDFPTGEAVLVSADYEHPGDRVDHTGTYLPTNGKPTVVFVDAIW